MPVIYRCSHCGTIIYRFLRAGQDYFGLPSPSELLARLGSNRCPVCGKPLSTNVELSKIEISVRRM
jgi:DNA-directed RNA polymerase subunit RPC12/RpoP